MDIVDLVAEDSSEIEQVALLLLDFSPNTAAAWTDAEAAYAEVEESLAEDRLSRIALNKDGDVIGWVAAAEQYSHAWELHPIVVRPDHQDQGVGRALVEDIEAHVAARGGLTVFLGADDVDEATTVSGIELFPGVLRHAEALQTRQRHPVGFWRRLGYEVVGLIPDANGRGRPDIWLAKTVAPWTEELEPDEPEE